MAAAATSSIKDEIQQAQASSSKSANPIPYSTSKLRVVEILSVPVSPPDFGPSWTYAQSSQARNWRFSAAALERIRRTANEDARQRIGSIWSQERQQPQKPQHEVTSSSSSSAVLTSDAEPPFLAPSEELSLISYYLIKIGQIVRACGLPEVVESTATTFVKRFFLRGNTVMDFHPKNVMITCIFLASKTENYPLNLQDFATKLAGKPTAEKHGEVVEENRRTILGLEFAVSQSLGFEYAVWGAHRALYGLILDLQTVSPPTTTTMTNNAENQPGIASSTITTMDKELIHTLAAASHKNLVHSRRTDAEFVFTPTQIALACLRLACREIQDSSSSSSSCSSFEGEEDIKKKGDAAIKWLEVWLDQKHSRAREVNVRTKNARVAFRKAEEARLLKLEANMAKNGKRKPQVPSSSSLRQSQAQSQAQPQPPAQDPQDSVSQDPAESKEFSDMELSDNPLGLSHAELSDVLTQIEDMIIASKDEQSSQDLEKIKEIDKKQKLCSALHVERREQTMVKREQEDIDDDDDDDDDDDGVAAAGGGSNKKKRKSRGGEIKDPFTEDSTKAAPVAGGLFGNHVGRSTAAADDDDDANVPTAKGFVVKEDAKV